MKVGGKNPENDVEYIIWKQGKCIISDVRKILRTKILALEGLNKISWCLYQIVCYL